MSINIKIRIFTSVVCTQLVLSSVCTIGLINPVQNPAFHTLCYLCQIINKVYDMLQVLPVKFGTLSNIQIVHYASNISCLKGGQELFIQNMAEEYIVCINW